MGDHRTLDEAGVRRAGEALWQAWDAHVRLPALPDGCMPVSVDDGYAIQDAMVAASGLPFAGWKIGATNRAAQAMLRLDGPVAGRLLAPFCHRTPARIPSADFAIRALEPEIAFRLHADLPPRSGGWDAGSVIGAVASAHPALEIPDTRLLDWQRMGAPLFIADNSAAGRFVLGDAVADWHRLDLDALAVRLTVQGALAAEGRGSDVMGHPLNALAWLANHLNARGTQLRAGELVTTGTCSPIRFAEPGDCVVADFGDFGRAEVELTL